MTGVQDSYGHEGNGPTTYRQPVDSLSQHKLLRDNDNRKLQVSSCLWTCPEITLCVAWWCELWSVTAGWSCKKTWMHSIIYPPSVCTASTIFQARPKATRVYSCPPGGCRAERATRSCWLGHAMNCSTQQSGSPLLAPSGTREEHLNCCPVEREYRTNLFF